MTVYSLLYLFLAVVVIGLALHLVNTYVPMADPIKRVLNAVVALVLLAWLVATLLGALPHPRGWRW